MQLFSELIFPSAVITYLISSPLRTWEYTVPESLIPSQNTTHTAFPSHGFQNHSVLPRYPHSCLLPKHDTSFDSCIQTHVAPGVGSCTSPTRREWKSSIHKGLNFLRLVFLMVLKRFLISAPWLRPCKVPSLLFCLPQPSPPGWCLPFPFLFKFITGVDHTTP